MHIALGADHAGVALKEAVKQLLKESNLTYTDFGATAADSVDYPDYAAQVAKVVGSGEFDRGILICGSGIGMAIAANKVRGVRAAAVGDLKTAQLCREHNNANILALGARLTPIDSACKIVRTFIETPFAGGRHQNRIEKITALEQEVSTSTAKPHVDPSATGS